MSYQATIGLEVHAELKTKSKMFCACANNPHHAEANSLTCPICMAHPGTLPVPNERAIEIVLMFGRAVGATQATYSEFDRKHYFYPDIPKAYQISQYAFPFLTGGSLCGVALTRVHLEEDTARSQHDQGEGSLVDFNRAGVPLMELVTEPVIHDATTAGAFARELQLILRTLQISDAHMEQGEMRVEANISVSKNPQKLGTKVEVKNLNSFRSVEGAINYEIARQIEHLTKGEEIQQETRGWDEVKLRTFTQRSKETAKDYRYFPDPDIPKLDLSTVERFSQGSLSEILPKLPEEKRFFYNNLGIPRNQYDVIIQNAELDLLVSKVVTILKNDHKAAQLACNYIVTDVLPLLISSKNPSIDPEAFSELINMLLAGEITSRVAKDLLPELIDGAESPRKLATTRGLLQISSGTDLELLVERVISDHQAVVIEYKNGKEAAVQFLVGQAMKLSRGSANPVFLRELLIEKMS